MAYGLFGTKPLPGLMPTYCQFNLQDQTLMKFEWKYQTCRPGKTRLKMSSAKPPHFRRPLCAGTRLIMKYRRISQKIVATCLPKAHNYVWPMSFGHSNGIHGVENLLLLSHYCSSCLWSAVVWFSNRSFGVLSEQKYHKLTRMNTYRNIYDSSAFFVGKKSPRNFILQQLWYVYIIQYMP